MDSEITRFIWKYFGWGLFFLVVGWAFWRGGRTEKIGASIIAVSWAIWIFLGWIDGWELGAFALALDFAGLIAFTWLSVHSRRPWVFFVTAAAVNSVVVHIIAKWLKLGEYSYVAIAGIWSGYAPLIGLGFGVWGYQRAQKKAALSNLSE